MSVPLKTSFRNAIKSTLIRISIRGGRPWNYMEIHYSDVAMSPFASQITSVSIVYSTVCSGADQRQHQSPASLTVVRGIHWWLVIYPNKRPLTRKMYPLDDVIMNNMSSTMINLLPKHICQQAKLSVGPVLLFIFFMYLNKMYMNIYSFECSKAFHYSIILILTSILWLRKLLVKYHLIPRVSLAASIQCKHVWCTFYSMAQ